MNHKDTPLQVIKEAIYKSIRNSKEFKTDDEKKRVVEQVPFYKQIKLASKLSFSVPEPVPPEGCWQ